jgi:hypothetical protein
MTHSIVFFPSVFPSIHSSVLVSSSFGSFLLCFVCFRILLALRLCGGWQVC